MKLRQLLKAHFETNGPTQMGRGILDFELNSKLLTVYLDELHKCFEFSGSEIEIIDTINPGKPKRVITGHDEEGIPMYNLELIPTTIDGETIVTTKLNEKTKFAPTVKLYSISLTPEMYDTTDFLNGEMDTVQVTPNMYDPQTMKPLNRIILTYSPDTAQHNAINELRRELKAKDDDVDKPEFTVKIEDGTTIKEQETGVQDLMVNVNETELQDRVNEKNTEYIQKLCDMVKDCFYNPHKYLIPGKRGILIRCTSNSLVQNETPMVNRIDTTVTLEKS